MSIGIEKRLGIVSLLPQHPSFQSFIGGLLPEIDGKDPMGKPVRSYRPELFVVMPDNNGPVAAKCKIDRVPFYKIIGKEGEELPGIPGTGRIRGIVRQALTEGLGD